MSRGNTITKCISVFVIALCFTGLLSCTALPSLPAATPAGPAPINPGDRIGDILVTTAAADETVFVWQAGCVQQGTEEKYRCAVTVGSEYNVSVGVYSAPDQGKSLEELWAEHTEEIFIADRPVNLAAFGAVDTYHPTAGKMRAWNVVLVASAPDEIAVKTKGKVADETWEEFSTYVFSAP